MLLFQKTCKLQLRFQFTHFQYFSESVSSARSNRLHRPYNNTDFNACRRMNGQNLTINDFNPGIRVEQSFISQIEEDDLIREVNELRKELGFKSQDTLYLDSKSLDDPSNQSTSSNNSSSSNENQHIDSIPKIAVDSYRVTGRPELSHQIRAPWGYADNFEFDKVPAVLKSIANKISQNSIFEKSGTSSSSSSMSSPLRDITINYRTNGMFRLDPHIDPQLDGSNVFILNLLSDAVVTFTPDLNDYLSRPTTNASPLKIRSDEAGVALRSWTDDDIDVLLRKRDLLHFTNDSRYFWKHAIRTGIEVAAVALQSNNIPNNGNNNSNKDEYKVCDWWGDLNHLSIRNNERISIVFAFL